MSPGAREVALEVIRRVTDEGAYSNRVLPAALARSGLDERDRALATELAYGTIRHAPGLDDAIGARAARPVARMTPGARAALRLGAYQVLHTRIPAHAAVGETVGIVVPRERGFVNAILRRLAKEPPAPPAGRDDRAISLRTGMAAWAVAELRTLLPPEEVEAAAAGFGERAPLTLRVNTCRSTVEEVLGSLREAGLEPRIGSVHPGCILLRGGDPTSLPGWDEGRFAVQDQASAFVVETLAPEAGHRVLDVCAAPGGKTASIACGVGDEGRVFAGDLRPERIAPIGILLERLALRAHLFAHDGTSPALRGPLDRVLVDAPCTGIGSARRRPELLWRARRDELSRLARLQVAIAAASVELLRPGGRLVYSVCTFPRAETDAACDAIQRHRSDLVPIETPGPAGAAPAPRHRLWPHRHGTDGMFVAAFERSG
jgi:16S rRNA (cytosine967-C5)-methyltransferase